MLPTVVLQAHIGGTSRSGAFASGLSAVANDAVVPVPLTPRHMIRQVCSPVQALVAASFLLAIPASAQPAANQVAITTRSLSVLPTLHQPQPAVNGNFAQRTLLSTPLLVARDGSRTLRLDPHDGNYAKRGAIVGALTTGVASAIVVGMFAKRDCEPGLCGSEFQRGALVGGGVGLAAGSVLGWLIGSEIARPQPQ